MKIKKGTIYILYGKNQNDVLYVGSTCNLFSRYATHCSQLKKADELIYEYLRENSMAINILSIEDHFEIDINELKQHENYWIEQFRQWGFPIKNITNNLAKEIRRAPKIILDEHIDYSGVIKDTEYYNFTDTMFKTKISRSTLGRLISNGKIKYKEFGTKKLYSLKDVINNKPRKKL